MFKLHPRRCTGLLVGRTRFSLCPLRFALSANKPRDFFGKLRNWFDEADTHYPWSYEIPRWVRPGLSYPSGVIFPETLGHESTLALRDCSPYPFPRPTSVPFPLPFHCNHGNNHSSLSFPPMLLRSNLDDLVPSTSSSLSLSFSLCMYVYIYICIYMYVCIYRYIYRYILFSVRLPKLGPFSRPLPLCLSISVHLSRSLFGSIANFGLKPLSSLHQQGGVRFRRQLWW